MRTGYFPGCSLTGSSSEFDLSLRAVADRLGIELVEVPDWNCCGASSAHCVSHFLSVALPARILALAEQAGLEELLVPCSACYSRLMSAKEELAADAGLRERVAEVMDLKLIGRIRIRNILEVLQQAIDSGKMPALTAPFDHKVACYYGCLLVRPPKLVGCDRPEDPQSMDKLMSAIGATPVDWAFKVECCGAGATIPRPELVGRLCADILKDAVSRGAEAIVTSCPMCHTNLDMRRSDAEKAAGRKFDIPVLYITQAFGLALGMDSKRLGLERHLVRVELKRRAAEAAGSGKEETSGPRAVA